MKDWRKLMRAAMLAGLCSLAQLRAEAQTSVPSDSILRAPTNPTQQGEWRWVSLDPAQGTETGWLMESGTATVTIARQSFAAELKLTAPSAGPDRRVRGKFRGRYVSAREMLLNTDANTMTLHGTDLHDGAEERLVFHGGPAGEASFLVLYRKISESAIKDIHKRSGDDIPMTNAMSKLFVVTLLSYPCALRAASVPCVGCPSDGQMGPEAAPSRKAHEVAVSTEIAGQLAWYKAGYAPGVLAPRGWHCFGTYGSSGATLYVTPNVLNGSEILSGHWKGLDGPAVEISSMNGGTSGRFELAHQVSRYFPQYDAFVNKVKAVGLEDASTLQTAPFPHDRVRRVSKDIVEFTTPAGQKGQGTKSMLRPSLLPIEGFVRVNSQPNDDPSDVTLEMRLTDAKRELMHKIVRAMELQSEAD